MTTPLTKTLRRRSAKKRTITDHLKKEIYDILNKDISNIVISEAKALLRSIIERREEVKKYDETIAESLIEEEENLDKEILEAHKFDIEVKKIEEKLNDFIRIHSKSKEQQKGQENRTMLSEETESSKSKNKNRVKLPIITIKPFDGQPINWNSFIEQFKATIDDQEDLTDIEKLTYLKGFLVGDALQTIEGLPLTNPNYTNGKDLLKARYGNPQ